MRSNPITIANLIASVTIGRPNRRFALITATIFFGSTTASLAAYSFLPVSGNWPFSGNAATSQFTSLYGNGVINVTHAFSAGGAGPDDNNNALIPSQFTTSFPGTGVVQGHLAQTMYGSTSIVTFDLTGYNLSSSTVFGMWNITDETTQPPYRLELIDAGNNPQFPTTFNIAASQDNQIQVQGRHQLVMNNATGVISAGATINGGIGIHTNAVFWDTIPTGTKKIIVYGNLTPIPGNLQGDGVGYYFAELTPEPCSFTLAAFGLFSLGVCHSRRRR